jgi:uncharacterized GH25 family protein
MTFTKSATLAAGLILALTSSVAAHYTFIMPEKFRVASGAEVNIGFHASDSFPESTQLPKRLENVQLHTSTGATALPAFRVDGLRQLSTIKPVNGYSIITAINPAKTENMKPASFTDYLKEESLTHVIEARAKAGETDTPGREKYSMYLKSIVLAGQPNDGYKKVVGLPIELVPEKDPYQIKKGESLPVRVLFKGAPAKNLEIFATSAGKAKNVGKTDNNGRINVPVTTGTWRLHTILMERVTLPDADWESFWATITFEIP